MSQELNLPELPPVPGHPEPHTYQWSAREHEAIREYGQSCAVLGFDAGRATVPVAQQAIRMTPELRAELVAWGRSPEGDEDADEALLAVLNAGAAVQQTGWVITLQQARKLVDFFGGHDAYVTVTPPRPEWGAMPTGLYAFCTEYPEDGSEYLGKTELDDALMSLAATIAPAETDGVREKIEQVVNRYGLLQNAGPAWEESFYQDLLRALHEGAPAEAARVRDQALKDAAKVCIDRADKPFPQNAKGMGFVIGERWHAARDADQACAAAIRALQGKPEAPRERSPYVLGVKPPESVADQFARLQGKPEAAKGGE